MSVTDLTQPSEVCTAQARFWRWIVFGRRWFVNRSSQCVREAIPTDRSGRTRWISDNELLSKKATFATPFAKPPEIMLSVRISQGGASIDVS